MDAAAAIRREALALGFDAVAIADAADAAAGPLEPEGGRLRAWLGAGMHGEMAFMAARTDERAEPRRIIPELRAVVVVAAGYLTADWVAPHAERGGVSRYAWGRDYHRFVQDRLRKLRRRIERLLPGVHAYTTVDTGPVMEKAWAVRAGLGWLGKHGCVITRDFASWAFLGVVLLDRALAPDPPAADRCGTCVRCIDVCPTRAIVAPGVVDARLCISYLTVEHRGPIPRGLRAAVGQRLFGCDDCQEACPWNRLARPAVRADWRPRAGWEPDRLDPVRVATWTRAEHREAAAGMAVNRVGYDGLRRNALVVLGNRGAAARGAVGAIAPLLGDGSAVVRGAAAWALGELGGTEAQRALRDAAAAEPPERDPEVRAELAAALARATR